MNDKHFFIKAALHCLFACNYYKHNNMDNLEAFLKHYDLDNFNVHKDDHLQKNFNLMTVNSNTTALELEQ